jgi:ribosomal protein S18 acetylase RimI-like enzyme
MISYTDTPEGLTPELLRGFFEGWPDPPAPETFLQILYNSSHVVLAVEGESGRVVGFVTAISDGVLCAYIPLLEVLPEYRWRGVGSELVRRVLARLEEMYMVDLICDPELRPFYRRLGMRAAAGMVVRNFERQSGV